MKFLGDDRLQTLLSVRWLTALAVSVVTVIVTHGIACAEWVWPQEVAGKEGKLTIYQPQLELFKADKVNARAAIAVRRKREKELVFGVFWFSARVVVDRDTRTVEFADVKADNMKFSNEVAEEDRLLAQSLVSQMTAKSRMSMSLDRFLSMTTAFEREKAESDELGTEPPKIIFATSSSVLVIVNGKPILRNVEGTNLQRVVNTPYVMLFDPSSNAYFLKGGNMWYAAPDIKGSWETVPRPPASVASAARLIAEPEDPAVKQSLREKAKAVPAIIVATEPAELIVTDGEPEYSVVPGTDLLYINNTQSDVFMDVKSRQFYAVLAGRWYRTASLTDGTWTHVPSQRLPATFYQIPATSEKGHVLTFVADTKQAEEAVVDAQIPQTAAIRRNEARIEVGYDGTPKFERIGGTDVEYAVNTSYQVLRIKGRYFACHQAVWFVSDSPVGPWVVSDYRPSEVDAIPPDSPVYNLKYVHVYDATPEVVYVGYTPGYLGTYVHDGTVVFGTGYAYPGWTGASYYPAPLTWGLTPWYYPYYGTWGFGAGFVSGSFFGFAAGVIASPWWGWGGWWPPAFLNININIGRQFHHRHGSFGHDRPHNIYHRPGVAAWNEQVRRDARFGQRPWSSRDPRVERLQRSGRQPRTDTRSGVARGQRLDRTQRSVREPGTETRQRSTRESAYDRRTGGVRQGGFDYPGRTERMRNNNVFATREGNVYRRTDRGWEQRDRGSWSRPGSLDRSGFYRNQPGLERDFYARSRGFERESSFRGSGLFRGGNFRGASSGSRPGSGGFSGSGSMRGAPGGSMRGGSLGGERLRGGASGGRLGGGRR